MTPSIKRAAILLALATPAAAFADEVGQWYLTPQFGVLVGDNDRPLEDKDFLYGLSFGRHLSEVWSLELNVNHAQLDDNIGLLDWDFDAASLDALAVMNRGGRVSPYFTIGAGALQNDLKPGPTSKDFMAQAGVGLMLKLWQNSSGTSSFALRPEVKARWDDAGAPGWQRATGR